MYAIVAYVIMGAFFVRTVLDLSERSFSLDRVIAVNIVIILFVLLGYGCIFGCIRFQMRWAKIERTLAPQWNLCLF